MFRNKHLVLALLVAPVLALIAWFSVDYFVAERPHAAIPGAAYELIAKPNCRRASGRCDLANKDVAITVPSYDDAGADVGLTSTIAADRAALGLAGDDPAALARLDKQGKRWAGRITGNIDAAGRMRVAIVISNTTFYAEVPVTFFVTD